MTGKHFEKTKTFFVVLLAALMALSFALFAACGKKQTEEQTDDTVYSKVENDKQDLTNGNFEFGTADVDDDEFPYTTVNGWSRATDNGASTSKVNSGIIDVAEWDALIDTLAKNSDFSNWAAEKYSIDKDALKTQAEADLKTELGTDEVDDKSIDAKTDELFAAQLKTHFGSPSVHEGAEGTKMIMLNNYSDQFGKGTAQKYTSSKTFTLGAGKIGKFTVWVNTGNISPSMNTDKFGANIRIINTVATVTQKEFAISDIKTDGEWKQYSIYVKANEFSETTLRLVFGLGYGADNSATHTKDYVEGTAYFDDAAFEEIEDQSALASANWQSADLVNTAATDRLEATLTTDNAAYLDLESKGYFNTLTVTADTKKTASNNANLTAPGEEPQKEVLTNGFKVTQSATSSTTTVTSENFKLEAGKYALVKFTLRTNLDKFQKKGLTVYVKDVYKDTAGNVIAEKSQKTLDSVILEEETTYTIIVKNNFDKDFADENTREFSLIFVLGPTDLAAATDATQFTTGSFEAVDFKTHSGYIDEEDYKTDGEFTDDDTEKEFNLYSLVNRTTTNTFTLAAYAGYNADYTSDESEETFDFREAYSDEGTITNAPARAAGYTGMNSYAAADASDSASDCGKAGLVNTKYLDKYAIDGLDAAALAWDGDEEDNMQPLMIYNESAGNYGFRNASTTIAANTACTITIRVRVVGNAVAYLYLVSTARDNLYDVIAQSFTGDDETEVNNELYVKVTADMMDSDGWCTVYFYVATGETAFNYRIELWNGERVSDEDNTDKEKSQGFVFFDAVAAGATFTATDILDKIEKMGEYNGREIELTEKTEYTRKLDETEVKFNAEQKNDADKVSYTPSVIWATDMDENHKGSFVMALFSTIDPHPVDPYGSGEDDGETTESGGGCKGADASTLALSVSSIILAVALVAAIAAVVIKAIIRKRKANKNDAKSHYKVTSRNKTHEAAKNKAAKRNVETIEEPTADDSAAETDEQTAEKEEYRYNDVLEDFSDADNADEENNENAENADGGEESGGAEEKKEE